MDLTQQLLTRCQSRQIETDNGTPTDAVILNIVRLAQFLRPHTIQQPTASGWRVRTEWLGYYEDGEGPDFFGLQAELLEEIAKRVAVEASKSVIVRKHKQDDAPIF